MYKLKSDIIFSQNEDGTIQIIKLFDTENGHIKIKGLSTKVFQAICANKNLDLIKAEILKEFDVENETLNEDIERLIQFLKRNQIIE